MRRIVAVGLAVAMNVAVAAPAMSALDRGPESSGAVTRSSAPGIQALFDPAVAMNGAEVPLMAVLNVAVADDLCSPGGPGVWAAGDGDLMIVETPSSHQNILLRDDVPVLIFDATGLGSVVSDVFPNLVAAVCGNGLSPIATGDARVRNKLHVNGSTGTFLHILDAAGNVSDDNAVWSLAVHRRAHAELPGPPASDDIFDTISLARRGG